MHSDTRQRRNYTPTRRAANSRFRQNFEITSELVFLWIVYNKYLEKPSCHTFLICINPTLQLHTWSSSLLVITSLPAFPTPDASLCKTPPITSLTRSVFGFRSRDVILGDFSHTLLVLRAMFGMRYSDSNQSSLYPSSNWGGYLHCSHG